jgi:predicted transcriptional regulator of viral defense system
MTQRRKITQSEAVLQQLASEHRLVVSGWRTLLLIRRATFELPQDERRWVHLPTEAAEIAPLLRLLRANGQIERILDGNSLDRVTVAFARHAHIDERECLMEIHPYAALSHLSAMVFHGIAIETPKRLIATAARNATGGLYPVGTTGTDWEDLLIPRPRKPKQTMGTPIVWNVVRPERYFGVAEFEPFGVPIRYTTLERTLLDGLQDPELSGGISVVLRAWAMARDRLHLDLLLPLTEQFGVALLRQRVGFVLDRLGIGDPVLEKWRANAKRGGSSKLVGAAPFASEYDERWNLSLNGPVHELTAGNW